MLYFSCLCLFVKCRQLSSCVKIKLSIGSRKREENSRMSCVEETSYGVFVRKVIEGNTRCCSQMYSWQSGVRVPTVVKVLVSSRRSRPALRPTQTPIESVMTAHVWSKLAVVWGWHSDPSSCELKNVWNFTSASPIYLNGVYRNNFIVFL